MTIATATEASPFYDFWMPDYCPECLASGCDRRAVMTEPDAVTWHGGKALVCDYVCTACEHQWQRDDLWTAQYAGITPPKNPKAA